MNYWGGGWFRSPNVVVIGKVWWMCRDQSGGQVVVLCALIFKWVVDGKTCGLCLFVCLS